MNARSQLYTLFHAMDPLDVLVQATAAGDTDTVRQYLYQHPDQVLKFTRLKCVVLFHEVALSFQVNRMVDGRGAMHEACKEGYWAVLEIILEYNPDLELTVRVKIADMEYVIYFCFAQDCNGLRPVHSCAYRYQKIQISSFLFIEIVLPWVQQLWQGDESVTESWS